MSEKLAAKEEWDEIKKVLGPLFMEGQDYSNDLMDKYVYPLLESKDAPPNAPSISLLGLLVAARKLSWLINVKSNRQTPEEHSKAWKATARMVDEIFALSEARDKDRQ